MGATATGAARSDHTRLALGRDLLDAVQLGTNAAPALLITAGDDHFHEAKAPIVALDDGKLGRRRADPAHADLWLQAHMVANCSRAHDAQACTITVQLHEIMTTAHFKSRSGDTKTTGGIQSVEGALSARHRLTRHNGPQMWPVRFSTHFASVDARRL